MSSLKILSGGHTTTTISWKNSFVAKEHPARIYRLIEGELHVKWLDQQLHMRAPGLYWLPPMTKSYNIAISDFVVDWLHYETDQSLEQISLMELYAVSFPEDVVAYWSQEWDDASHLGFSEFANHRGLLAMLHSLHWRVMKDFRSLEPSYGLQKISPALNWLDQHPIDRPSMESLANYCHCSSGHFQRLFKSVTGRSPLQYAKERLMNLVLFRLHQGQTLSQIADQVAYPSPFTLSRDFKKHFGCSPREHLKRFVSQHPSRNKRE